MVYFVLILTGISVLVITVMVTLLKIENTVLSIKDDISKLNTKVWNISNNMPDSRAINNKLDYIEKMIKELSAEKPNKFHTSSSNTKNNNQT